MLVRNVAAGLASSIGAALIGLAVVPVYIRLLGIEAYGLIGFFFTLQALFQILDLGLAPTVNREVALASAGNDLGRARVLLHSMSVVYWSVACLIGMLLFLTAPMIASHWLKSKSFSSETLSQVVAMMGVVIAARWPIALYQATLIGRQRLVAHSAITLGMAAVAALGAVVTLSFVSTTVSAFFLWQAIAGISYALISRSVAWRSIGKDRKVRFSLPALKSVWKFSSGMIVLTAAGLVFSQLDKVILSKLLGLAEFGQYMLAAVVAGALGTVISPFYNAVFPRFAGYVAAGDARGARDLYERATRLIATILFTLALVLVLFSEDLIALWTGNSELARAVAPIVALLAAGTALHGTMYIPHALMLAKGKVGVPIATNLILLIVVVPMIATLTVRFGVVGGAWAWLILHALYVVIATTLTHRCVVPEWSGLTWFAREIGIPLAVTCLVGAAGYFILGTGEWTKAARFGLVFALAVANVSLIVSASPTSFRIGSRRSSLSVHPSTGEESS